jgi:Na+/phosphate symporter
MIDKEVGEKMINLSQNLSKMLGMVFQGFGTMTDESVKEVEKVKKDVQKSSAALTSFLILKSAPGEKGNEWAKPFLSMASSFDRISYNIEGIAERLRKMVREDIPFSDRAVKETTQVLQDVTALLTNLPDLILTQNKMLSEHIQEKGKAVFKEADAYSEEHERRLIEGFCMPKASPVYLGILESFKAIAMHVADLSEKIVSLRSKS